MRRILITGCNGEVGQVVVQKALEAGHYVVGVDNTPSKIASNNRFAFQQADLQDAEKALKVVEGCDAIIHLAAKPNPGDYRFEVHNINVVISWNILRAAAEHKITRIAQASSVNVIGLGYNSNPPQFDYLPLDENHPGRSDEGYGLSKQICELQADTVVRRYPFMRIASLRLHWFTPSNYEPLHISLEQGATGLWGWVQSDEAARAFLLAITTENESFKGHEAFHIVAPEIAAHEPSDELAKKFFPHVPLRREFKGKDGFWDCSKAERLFGWIHA